MWEVRPAHNDCAVQRTGLWLVRFSWRLPVQFDHARQFRPSSHESRGAVPAGCGSFALDHPSFPSLTAKIQARCGAWIRLRSHRVQWRCAPAAAARITGNRAHCCQPPDSERRAPHVGLVLESGQAGFHQIRTFPLPPPATW